MMFLGLDLNAGRARAVSGPVGDFPCPLPLVPPCLELPLVLSLEKSVPEVGAAGVRLLRQLPHLTYRNFLARLGAEPDGKQWLAQRSLDAVQALQCVFQRLQPICLASEGVVLAVPCYMNRSQADYLLALGRQGGLPLLGTVPASLAAALAAYAEQAWYGSALVLDIDDHALTLSALNAVDGRGQFLDALSLPHLGLQVWKERLLNALADCCVVQSRRDPRASPQAEQALYEQLDSVFDACRQGRLVQLALQSAQWYQNLVVAPEQPASFCAGLVRQVIREIEERLASPWPDGPPGVLLITAQAGRLPGLVQAARSFLEEWAPARLNGFRTAPLSDDFGEALFQEGPGGPVTVQVLSADAPARGAHSLAAGFHRGDWPAGHLDQAALPLPQPVEAGPARLHFQGEDYFINEVCFSLGRQPGCNLVFDGEFYRGISPRHCEILFEHSAFMLIDRSREGTLVNDGPVPGSVVLRPGDWIRLGPEGPLLRFLGQMPGFTPLLTTA